MEHSFVKFNTARVNVRDFFMKQYLTVFTVLFLLSMLGAFSTFYFTRGEVPISEESVVAELDSLDADVFLKINALLESRSQYLDNLRKSKPDIRNPF